MPLPEEKRSEIKQAFNLYDRTGSGSITINELGLVMRAVGKCPSEREIQEVKEEMQLGETIDLATMEKVLEKYQDKFDLTQEQIVEAFQVFDPKKTGSVSLEELKHVLSVLGETLTKEEVENMVSDHVVDGKVNYEEFSAVLASTW